MAAPVEPTYALITGANQGIGLQTATRLAKEHGYHVIIGSRNAAAGEAIATTLQSEGFQASSVQLDVTSQASIVTVAQSITERFGRLDVLVHNAAILIDGNVPNITTRELFERTFATNVTGVACLTEELLPLLRKSTQAPRLVFVSTRIGSLDWAKNRDAPFYHFDSKAYDASKAALNMLALNYSRILEDTGARVNCACPGLVSTNLHPGVKPGMAPYDGATRIVQLATLNKNGPTETFSDVDGEIKW